MKHTIFSCAKYKRLRASLINEPECVVVGVLELLFQYGAANGPELSACDVEIVCGWGGALGALYNALTDTQNGKVTNFLDVLDGDRVSIHDFFDHAPTYVKQRAYQKRYREKNKGVNKSYLTLDNSDDKRNETKRNETKPISPNGDNICSKSANDHDQLILEGASIPSDPDPNFKSFWEIFPRKVKKIGAEKAWKAAIKREKPEIIIEALRRQLNTTIFQCESTYHPNPVTWLSQGRWEDVVEKNHRAKCSDIRPGDENAI